MNTCCELKTRVKHVFKHKSLKALNKSDTATPFKLQWQYVFEQFASHRDCNARKWRPLQRDECKKGASHGTYTPSNQEDSNQSCCYYNPVYCNAGGVGRSGCVDIFLDGSKESIRCTHKSNHSFKINKWHSYSFIKIKQTDAYEQFEQSCTEHENSSPNPTIGNRLSTSSRLVMYSAFCDENGMHPVCK